MTTRTLVLFLALSVLAAIEQLLSVRWGLLGESAGSLLSGAIILVGWRAFAPDTGQVYLLPLFAFAASLLGLWSGIAGSAMAYTPAVWMIALLSALPCGVPALWISLRAPRCHHCQKSLRGVLSFSCPRCSLVACENCWEFDRDRCQLCAANQVPLFPVDPSWWQKHFGQQVYQGRCALCLNPPDLRVAHWPCPACGHAQCRLCWDDNNGQCSRCAWTIAQVPQEMTADSPTGPTRETHQRSNYEPEIHRAQVSDAFRYSSRGKEIQRRH